MPEIAEVKMIANSIKDIASGRILVSVLPGESSSNKKFYDSRFRDVHKLCAELPLKIVDVKTHGKFAYIVLDNCCYIGFGCGMTGNIKIDSTEWIDLRHCHIQFNLEPCSGSNCGINRFYYDDTRRIGNWYYLDQKQLNSKLKQLGFDVLTGKEQSKKDIVQQFRRFRSNICKILLNQKCLAGVGNYMKSEILFTCKIDPFVTISDLSDEQLYQLYQHSRIIAQEAFKAGKTNFKDFLKVYHKDHCPTGEKVVWIPKDKSHDRRSTFWVPSIQRPEPEPESIRTKIVLKQKPVAIKRKPIILKNNLMTGRSNHLVVDLS